MLVDMQALSGELQHITIENTTTQLAACFPLM